MDIEIKEALDGATKTLVEVKQAQTDLSEKLKLLDEKKASGEDITDINSRIEDSRKEIEELGEKMIDVTRQMSARKDEAKSFGRLVAEQKDFKSRIMGRETVEIKDITSASFGNITLPAGVRRGNRGLIEPVNQTLFLRDVIPSSPTSSAIRFSGSVRASKFAVRLKTVTTSSPTRSRSFWKSASSSKRSAQKASSTAISRSLR